MRTTVRVPNRSDSEPQNSDPAPMQRKFSTAATETPARVQTISCVNGWRKTPSDILVSCVGMGTMMSLGVFLQPLTQEMGWTRAGVSVAAVLNFLCMGAGSLFWGSLSDRLGTRTVVLIGGVLLGAGVIATSYA